MAAVFVAAGAVQQEVAHATQFQPLQLRGAFRPDAAQGGQRRLPCIGRTGHGEFIKDWAAEREGKGAFQREDLLDNRRLSALLKQQK
jgi:hypothetical protein